MTEETELGPTDEQYERRDEILAEAAEQLADVGISEHVIPHAIINGGLEMLAGSLCTEHLIEQLTFVQEWIGDRIADARREAN